VPPAEACAVDTEACGVSADIRDRRQGVVERGGKWVLGGQAVFDRDDSASARIRERPSDGVVRRHGACHQAAAVEVDQPRQYLKSGIGGGIDPDREWPGRSGQGSVFDAAHYCFGTRQLHEFREA
jgi:hypothetical protein